MYFDKTYCDKVKCNMCDTYQWVEVDETEHCLACGETGYLMDVEPENEMNRYQYVEPQIIE